LNLEKAESLMSSKQRLSQSIAMCTTSEAQPSFFDMLMAFDQE